MVQEQTLGQRLGLTCHVSPLRMRLMRLWQRSSTDAETLEDWLVDCANARGARVVVRKTATLRVDTAAFANVSNEELAIGLLLLQNRDRPQILRLGAQLISRGAVDFEELRRMTVRERVQVVLAELARQAIKIDAEHSVWTRIRDAFEGAKPPASALLHHTAWLNL
jgi:hypothetical protein